jgi:exonuclease III
MLEEFLRHHEIDILLVQEVTQHFLRDVRGYNTHYNVGANKRGTAIMTREGISLENITMIPSGRAIAAKFREVRILNVYSPSGNVMKQERERFFYF